MTENQRRGISYLEVILVIGILSTLSAIAAPRVGQSVSHYRLERAAWHMAKDITYAQTLAAQSSDTQMVVFDSDTDQILLSGVERLDHIQGDYVFNLQNSLYDVDLVKVEFINDANVISDDTLVFDLWGIPMCGLPDQGYPYSPLTSGIIVLALGQETRTLNITPVTGNITIE